MTTPDILPETVNRFAKRCGPKTAAMLRALREALTAAEAQAQRAADDMWAAVVRADGLEEILARTDERATAAEARAEAAERALTEQEVGGYVLIPRDALRGTSLDCIFKDERLALCRKKLAMNEIMILIDLVQSAKAHKAEARAEAAEKSLRVAAGLISTMDEHKHKHPEEVLDWLARTALGREP